MKGAALARAGHAVFANRHTYSSAWTTSSDERSASHASASARGASPGSSVAPRRFTPSSKAPRSRTGLPAGSTAGRRRVLAAATSDTSGESFDAEKESFHVESSRVGGTTKDDWSHVTPDWLYRTIEPELSSYLSEFEREEVYQAVQLAYDAHDGQRRKSGEPFITHPVAVAGILAEQKMDHETVIAGLLHDTVEDTDHVTFESIEDRFGRAVRRIVEGETKVSKVSSSVSKKTAGRGGEGANSRDAPALGEVSKNDVQADDLREMFLAMTQEVRVIIVKLADRLHNMRTLGSLKPEKRVKISRETLLVFAPLAKLLGMYRVKNELEDLAFRWSSPEAHAETARWFDELSKRQEPTVTRTADELRALCESDPFLRNACARVEVIPRAKELYGVYRESQKEKKETEPSSLAERLRLVREVAQLRVVLELDDADVADGGANGASSRVCYHVLGLVHERWPPVPGRMNDYIATPKLNGYRALHTVVLPIGDSRKRDDEVAESDSRKGDVFPIELQIRTGEMHRMAESGIAADPEVKAAWRATARRAARRMRDARRGDADLVSAPDLPSAEDAPSPSVDGDSDSDDDPDDACKDAEDSVLIRSGHARQVAWLSNIREWQEEFLGVLTAEEFVDTVTGDLLGRRVFVFTKSGGVMNLPHGSTVVDFAFYTDAGLDAVACSVNGVPCEFDRALKNADVVEIFRGAPSEDRGASSVESLGRRESNESAFSTHGLEFSDGELAVASGNADIGGGSVHNLELLGGAGEASAAAVAGAARKQRIAAQRRFLTIARTRSARAKIKKFLAEHGALDDEVEPDSVGTSDRDAAAARRADEDTLDATEEVSRAARELVAAKEGDAAAKAGSYASLSRAVSGARVTLRCVDKDGLLREISSTISAIEGCSIVGYAGESSAKREFLMTYTIVLETPELSEAEFDGSQSGAEAAVMDVDARLRALFEALRAHDRVLDARLFCKLESSSGDVFGGV